MQYIDEGKRSGVHCTRGVSIARPRAKGWLKTKSWECCRAKLDDQYADWPWTDRHNWRIIPNWFACWARPRTPRGSFAAPDSWLRDKDGSHRAARCEENSHCAFAISALTIHWLIADPDPRSVHSTKTMDRNGAAESRGLS